MIYFQYLLYSIAFVYACSLLFDKRKKMFFLVTSGVMLTLFLGLREIETGGIDLIRYNRQYDIISEASSIDVAYEIREGGNILFFATMYVFAKLGLTFQQFLIIIGAFSVSSSLLLYYRYSNYPLICVVLFLPTCYIHLFSQLKQTVAVSIMIFAYMLLRKNKMKWAYALLVVAILFHPTAIVMVPFFILCRYRVTQGILIVLLTGSFIVFILRMDVGHLLTLLFYDNYIGTYISKKSITGMATLFLIFTIIYLIMMPKQYNVSKEKYLLISSYLYALIIAMTLFFCASYSYAFTRLNNYFLVFVPLALSELAEFDYWKRNYMTKAPVYILFGIIMYIMLNWFLDMVKSQRLEQYNNYWIELYEKRSADDDLQEDEEP